MSWWKALEWKQDLGDASTEQEDGCRDASSDVGVGLGGPGFSKTNGGIEAFTHRWGQPRLCQTFSGRFFHLLRGAWHWGSLTLGLWEEARARLCHLLTLAATSCLDHSWLAEWCFRGYERCCNKALFSSLEGLVQRDPSGDQSFNSAADPPWGSTQAVLHTGFRKLSSQHLGGNPGTREGTEVCTTRGGPPGLHV